jgi:AraC-like DNA-binding protein
VVDTSRIGIHVEPEIQDSMVSIEVSDTPNFVHPLLSRTLAVDQSRPFINGFPLLPGNYHVRISSVKKNRLKTDFSPAKQLEITHKRKNDSLRIVSASIEDEFTGVPADELVPGQWYVFRSSLSIIQDCFALFWLHHPSFTYGGFHNKGGYFDRERNYIFNLSLTKDPWLYGSREDIKGRSIRVDGNRYLYLDDRDNFFKQDTNSKTVQYRFKLLKEALPGIWMLSGYIEEDRNNRSYLFTRPIRVLSDREISLRQLAKSKKVRFRILAAVAGLILAGCLAVSFISYRRRRFKIQPENILTLLSRGEIFIRVKDHKYRHVVARAQKYIFENLNQEISLSDVAKDQNRSSTWIAQVFKKATGFTVVRFINRVKIERAKEYLSKRHSITDTALQVGFAGHEHFRRVFKEQTGMTPTEFKKKVIQ